MSGVPIIVVPVRDGVVPSGGLDAVAEGADVGASVIVVGSLAAVAAGDLAGLVAMLAPDVTMTADGVAAQMGAQPSTEGSTAVAEVFSGRALGARAAIIDGAAGFAWTVGDGVKVAWDVVVVDGAIVHINVLAAPETLARTPIAELP